MCRENRPGAWPRAIDGPPADRGGSPPGDISVYSIEEIIMKRHANGLAVLVAAALVSGCSPETPSPPVTETAQITPILPPEAKGRPGPAAKKKNKVLGPATAKSRDSAVKLDPNL
jgi:hypothetical protein